MLTTQALALSAPHAPSVKPHEAIPEIPAAAAVQVSSGSSAAGEQRLATHEIIAVLSSENYSKVVTERQRWFVRRTMSEWEAMLPAGMFIRVHRTAIVNLAAVESLERRTGETTLARLRGFPQPVRVSRSRQLALRVALAERR